MDQAKNFAKGTLITAIDDDDTELTVDLAQGLRFPAPPFNATIWNSTDFPDPADDPNVEIVRVTAISDDVLTITRAQEGTAAGDHGLTRTHQIVAGLTAKVINDHGPAWDRITDDGDEFRVNDGESAVLAAHRANGTVAIGDIDGLNEGTKVTVNDPATTVTITKQLILPDLPSSDPAVAGALYYDTGTGAVKRSAG